MPDGTSSSGIPGPYRPQQPQVWHEPQHYPQAAGGAESDGGDGWDSIRKVWRRKWLVAGVAAGFAVLAGVSAATMTPHYTTEARILLGVQDPNVIKMEQVLEGFVPSNGAVRSEAYVIESRQMARQVAYRLALDQSPMYNPELRPEPGWTDKLSLSYAKEQVKSLIMAGLSFVGLDMSEERVPTGLEMTPEELAAAEKEELWTNIESKLLSQITVEPLNRSNVLSLTVEATDPQVAARIANSFANIYVEQKLSSRRAATGRANDWLQTRIDELRGEVRESERAVEEYRQRHDLYATKSDTVIGQQLAALNAELARTEGELSAARARLSQAETQEGNGGNADSLPAVLQSPLIRQLRGQQSELESEAADLSANYTDRHPRIRNIRAQIADVTSKINAEIDRTIDGLRNEVQIASNQFQSVRNRMDELKAEMGVANTESVELRRLERDAEANRSLLESLLQRSKETMSQSSLLTSNADVLSNAAVPRWPSFPPTNLILLLGTMVGIGLGVLIALVLEKLDQTFRTSDEIEEFTGLPTLALIPILRRLGSGRMDHVLRNPHSVYANSLRMLATFLSSDSDIRSLSGLVVFTSAVAAEGKSHTSCSFAQLLASEGRKVILLDLDWRQPTQHRLFGERRRAGVIELLSGKGSPEDIVHHDKASGVDVLFAGDTRLMQGRTVPLERLQLLLHTLSQHYDVIVVDTSPTMLTPEVMYLARIADHFVMNVKWGQTTRRAVTTEIKNILRSGGRVSGVALSHVDLDRYTKYSYADGGYLRHGYLVQDA
ncbi:MAG: polysaccharide biosynthesis tyrosine autokinase [Acetobacterales bacterium]